VGIQFAIDYIHQFESPPIASPSRTNDLAFGAAIDVDLMPPLRLPMGAVGAYQLDVPLENGNSLQHRINVGVFYSDRHLILGPEVSFQWFDLSLGQSSLPSLSAFATIIQVFFQYTW
jgi:hypothetical protein